MLIMVSSMLIVLIDVLPKIQKLFVVFGTGYNLMSLSNSKSTLTTCQLYSFNDRLSTPDFENTHKTY